MFTPLPRRMGLAAILFLAFATPAPAADPKSAVESVLTPETVGFLHVRFADIWESPGLAFYRKLLASLGEEEFAAIDAKFVPSPRQFETLTVIMPSVKIRNAMPEGKPTGESFLFVGTTKKPIEQADIMKSLGFEGRIKSHQGTNYIFEESHWAGMLLLDPTTLVVGAEDSILRLIEQRAKPTGKSQLAKLFAREASKHTATLAVNPAVLTTPEIMKELPDSLKPLLKASVAWAALDMKQLTMLSTTIDFATPEQTKEGEQAVSALRKLAHDLIEKGKKEIAKNESEATTRPVMGFLDLPAHFNPILGKAALKYLEASLKNLQIETNGTTVRTSLNLSEFFPANADALLIMAFAGLNQFGGRYYMSGRGGDREEIPYYINDQFKRISAALEAYHKDKGNYPPAAIYSKDGQPLLSWRVLILPYMEQRPGDLRIDSEGYERPIPAPNPNIPPGPPQAAQTFEDLYKKFKLDEPWDSQHNKQLIERMPRPFRIDFTMNNWRSRSEWKTGMQVFQGPDTLFPGKNGVSKGQVRDGVDGTVAVIFRDDPASSVAWTKPMDIPFAADKRLPKLISAMPEGQQRDDGPYSSSKPPGLFVILADGKARRLPADFDEKDLKALITIAGGESVKVPEFKLPENKPTPNIK